MTVENNTSNDADNNNHKTTGDVDETFVTAAVSTSQQQPHPLPQELVDSGVVVTIVFRCLLDTQCLGSNADLAALSNTSRTWRQCVHQAVVQHSRGTALAASSRCSRAGMLLLPSMMREFQRRESPSLSSLEREDRTKDTQSPQERDVDNDDHETYCAAWFSPDGMVPLWLTNASESSSSDSDGDDNDSNDNDNGVSEDGFTTVHRRQQRQQHRTRRSEAAQQRLYKRGAWTCREWRGRSTALQVLRPFGYTAAFLELCFGGGDVTAAAAHREVDCDDSVAVPPSATGTSTTSEIVPSAATATTFAVRGALVARPESYCYCVDPGPAHMAAASLWSSKRAIARRTVRRYNQQRRALQRDVLPRLVTRQETLQVDEENADSTIQSTRYSPKLPPQRCVQFLNVAGSHAVCLMTPRFPMVTRPTTECNRTDRPNEATRPPTTTSSAPSLMPSLSLPPSRSPKQPQQPHRYSKNDSPVTMLCVGICTEDGCLVSGLFRRFELGHLYPDDALAETTELSRVCLATARPPPSSLPKRESSSSSRQQHGDGDGVDDGTARTAHRMSNSGTIPEDSTTSDSSRDQPRCDCIFDGVTEKLAIRDDDDDDTNGENDYKDDNGNNHTNNSKGHQDALSSQRMVHRGQIGPGSWHCYTAIFDGPRSLIRVDGVPQIMAPNRAAAMQGDNSSSSNNNNNSNNVSTFYSASTLDGLTIGSDHSFNMSLCCGDGSDGTGQGAIAELAVFHGRFDESDLTVLETQLLQQHDIPASHSHDRMHCPKDVQDGSAAARSVRSHSPTSWTAVQENDMERRAAALFVWPDGIPTVTPLHSTLVPSASESSTERVHVPLRYLAQHRSVAWKRVHPVTGVPVSIKRIGCRAGASSSDF